MRIKRNLCYLLYNIFAIRLPKTNARISLCSKCIRGALVRGFAEHAGKGIDIQKGAKISRALSIGNNSGVGINCVLQGKVIIGDAVMMGPEVWIYTRNHKHSDLNIPMRDQGFEEERPVHIGNDVWIGSRVTILPGVTIGDGSIIGTGSVVTKDVPPFAVVGGNPAKVLKSRKDAEKVQ